MARCGVAPEKKKVISTNELNPVGSFRQVDVDALMDRICPQPAGIIWMCKLPSEFKQRCQQNAARTHCPRCSARFINWCMLRRASDDPVSCGGDTEHTRGPPPAREVFPFKALSFLAIPL